MTLYGGLLLIHVLAAVIGMGPSFIFPIIQMVGTTKESLQLINKIMEKAEKVVQIGSYVLLASGLLMGVMNTSLFTQAWYITSIILFIVAVYLAVGFQGPRAKKAVTLLNSHTGEDIPDEVIALNKSIGMAGMASAIIVIVMITFMSIKPF